MSAVGLLVARSARNVLTVRSCVLSWHCSQLSYSKSSGEEKPKDWWKQAKSIYEFTATDIDGNEVSLEKYRGHVCLIVDTACK
jgi:hypothetical protein